MGVNFPGGCAVAAVASVRAAVACVTLAATQQPRLLYRRLEDCIEVVIDIAIKEDWGECSESRAEKPQGGNKRESEGREGHNQARDNTTSRSGELALPSVTLETTRRSHRSPNVSAEGKHLSLKPNERC